MTPPLTRRHAVLALGASWVAFFAKAVFLPTLVPYYRDHLVTNVPVRDYVRERMLSGELPQWFPYEGLGVPLIGQIALGTFHPFNLLLTPLPAVYGEKWALLGAYLFGLCGAYKAARAIGGSRWASVLAAWTYGFGGYVLGMSSIIAYALSTSALPWVVWAATRLVEKQRARDAAALAVAAALVFLSGDALGFALTSVLCLIAFSAKPSRRALLLMIGAGAWAALLVGIELLPATVLGADSVRNVGTAPPTLAFTWATHPLRLLELVHGGFIPDEVRPQVLGELLGGGTATFATTLYFGVVALGACAAGLSGAPRTAKLAVGAGLFFVLLALGGHLGLLGLLQAVLPVLGKFRYPERYLAFFWGCTLWIVPLGFDRALEGAGRRAFRLGVAVAGAVNLGLLMPFAVQALWSLRGRVPDAAVAEKVAASWRVSGAIGLAVAIAAAVAVGARVPRVPWLALGALLFVDLWRANSHHLPLVDASVFQPSPLAAGVRGGRVASLAQRQWSSGVTLPGREEWVAGTLGRLRPTCAALSRVETLGSNLGATQRRHAIVFGVHDPLLARLGGIFNACSAVVDDVGQAPEGAVRAPELQLRLEPRDCWPRAFLAKAWATTLEGSAKGFEQVRLRDRRVPWEGPTTLDSDEGTVRMTQRSPEVLEVEVDAARSTALIVTNDWAPGWTATLDGADVPLYPALITALGVEVPPGAHGVTLTFRTPRLGLGLTCTLVGVALLVAVLVSSLRASKKRDVMPA